MLLKFSYFLKILSNIVAVMLAFYGVLIGVLGMAPHGSVPLYFRFIGLYVLMLGVYNLFPNIKISSSKNRVILFFVANLFPILFLLIASYKRVYDEGLKSFFDRGGLVFLLVLIPVFSLAPLSLWVYIKARRMR